MDTLKDKRYLDKLCGQGTLARNELVNESTRVGSFRFIGPIVIRMFHERGHSTIGLDVGF